MDEALNDHEKSILLVTARKMIERAQSTNKTEGIGSLKLPFEPEAARAEPFTVEGVHYSLLQFVKRADLQYEQVSKSVERILHSIDLLERGLGAAWGEIKALRDEVESRGDAIEAQKRELRLCMDEIVNDATGRITSSVERLSAALADGSVIETGSKSRG